jgi:predicted metal-dependent phosphoesterase TrpH
MPAGQPFTHLCQQLARPRHHDRADLHLHTTASDGLYTPAQLVDVARRSGLAAIAVTDHDTLDGILPARKVAGPNLEVIAGVEITSEFQGKELHLLGYFVDLDEPALAAAMRRLRDDRVGRFHAMVERLQGLGVHVTEESIAQLGDASSLGRRHLAELLVQQKHAGSVREAFQRYLGDKGRATVPKTKLPVADAIAAIRQAGGVAAWAHPLYDCSLATLRELRGLGMQAVEASFPSCRPSREGELKQWARALDLATTGGSDCHGPGMPHRAVGSWSISQAELQAVRAMCSAPNSTH